MIELVVFDLDGTLVDTPSGIVTAFGATFDSVGVGPASPGDIRATIGLPLAQAFATLIEVPESNPLVARCVATYQVLFAEIVLPTARSLVFPGVSAGLAALRQHGLVLAVATSKFLANADALLVAAELRPLFSLVVGADQVSRPKPSPDIAEYVLNSLDVAPSCALMVGDTTHDIGMANAAGMRSIAVSYGVHSRDALAACGPTWASDNFAAVVTHALSAAGQG